MTKKEKKRIYDRAYCLAHREERKQYSKKYRLLHSKEISEQNREYRLEYNEECNLYQREYYKSHKKDMMGTRKKWTVLNREKVLAYSKKSHQLHKEQRAEYYRLNHKKIRIRQTKYRKAHKFEATLRVNIRYATDVNFKLSRLLRSRLWHVLKGYSKSKPTLKLLGCSLDKLKQHIESQFKPGMTWANWGTGTNGKGMQEWHIDHIKPCCKFDLSKPSEQQKCFNWKNLQPLWADENLSKSGIYVEE
jgi:hypothetical protein